MDIDDYEWGVTSGDPYDDGVYVSSEEDARKAVSWRLRLVRRVNGRWVEVEEAPTP